MDQFVETIMEMQRYRTINKPLPLVGGVLQTPEIEQWARHLAGRFKVIDDTAKARIQET